MLSEEKILAYLAKLDIEETVVSERYEKAIEKDDWQKAGEMAEIRNFIRGQKFAIDKILGKQ